MTDEQLDERLRRAGAEWRAAHTAVVAPDRTADLRDLAAERRQRPKPRRTALFATAAIVAAAVIAGGAFLLSGTGTGNKHDGAGTAVLKGSVWRLLGFGSDGNQLSSSAVLYLSRDGKLVVDDDCTVAGGSAKVTDGSLTVSHLVVRYRSCTDTTGVAFAPRGLDTLRGRARYTIDGDELTIRRPGAATMHLQLAPDLPPPTMDVPTFIGAKWQLVRQDGRTVSNGRQTLQIKDDRTFTSYDGANALSGSVDGVGPRVRFTTRTEGTAGSAGGANDASRYDETLNGWVTQLVSNGQLTITKKGVGTLVFRWVPTDTHATETSQLLGRTWHLRSVFGDAAESDLHLTIGKDGRLTTTGCTALTGTTSVEPGTLTVTHVTTHATASCATDGDQEKTIDSFLRGRVVWSIRDGQLIIGDGGAQSAAIVYGRA